MPACTDSAYKPIRLKKIEERSKNRRMKQIVVLSLFFMPLLGAQAMEAIRAVAFAWTDALVRQDEPALHRLLTDDLYFANSDTRSFETKAEYIASVTAGPRYESLQLRDVTIHVYGTSAVLSSYADAKQPGSEPFILRFMQLYVLTNGKWQMASSACTPVRTNNIAAQQSVLSAPASGAADLIVRPAQSARFQDSSADEVRHAAIGWTQAIVKKDKATLEQFLADDLIFVHSNGTTIQSKPQYLSASERSTYEALPMSAVKIRRYERTAVLTAYIDTKNIGREAFRVRTFQVFRKESGRWRLAAFQSTRVSPL